MDVETTQLIAEGYEAGVLDGSIPCGQNVVRAVKRQRADVARFAKSDEYRFNAVEACRVIEFFQLLKHSKGEWAGKPIRLAPWQVWIFWVLFGWQRRAATTDEDGREVYRWVRRFTHAYLEIPRKNGKSTIAAGVGLFMLWMDREPGAEVYVAATKMDQARICFEEAKRMVQQNPALRRHLAVTQKTVTHAGSYSKLAPLASDENTMDGLNPNAAIVDELHAHKSREVFEKLDTATGSRRQPLIFAITTAGRDPVNSVCGQHHGYAESVLLGTLTDDTLFAYISSADPDDDWKDELTWRKANPNYGVSVKPEQLRKKARRASGMPGELASFLQLHLNRWTQEQHRWLNIERWNAGKRDIDWTRLTEVRCWGGLDLSSVADVTSFTLVWREDDEWIVRPWFWIPDERAAQREHEHRVPYTTWEKSGHLRFTEGRSIDQQQIRDDILRIVADHPWIEEIGYDPWNSSLLVQELEETGITMTRVNQTYQGLNEAAKVLYGTVEAERLVHDGNPVMTWMAGNVVAAEYEGNIRPSKTKSFEKIDGISALCTALARAIYQVEGSEPSVTL